MTPNNPITLFLFDVDGVLLYPAGYKVALRATLDHFAESMGQPPVGLTLDEIAVFEACGITNEWDSAPMCLGALLVEALSHQPDLRRSDVRNTLESIRRNGLRIMRPDFAALARQVRDQTPPGSPPTAAIQRVLGERADGSAAPLLVELFANIYDVHTPTTFVFQHYTLGGERFAQTYGLPAAFEAESALVVHDRPLLDADHRARLADWASAEGQGMAIFTARPSLPPADLPAEARAALNPLTYPPEGDLAAELLGLAGEVPLISGGRMTWLAEQRDQPPGFYIKPSPVQAIAAIAAAASGEECAALLAAADFFHEGVVTGPLALLSERPVRAVVFEDSSTGIEAARAAVDLLRAGSLDVTVEAIGVAPERAKQEALRRLADHVVEDVNQAVDLVLG
jgi:phosphoglycolate phosphatase-like HAD superfamily hydrolase